ncbi:unnamed protein product [Rotaria magnacalcarata]
MSRRSSMMEDKLISEMILKNIATVSQMNVDMDDILNIQQMKLLTTYKQIYNYAPCLSFFLSLGILSHFAQGSYYTHYASCDHRPVQLYLWLLGSSGSGKTDAFRQLEKAISKTEKMFSSTYLKAVIVSGKPTETDLSSIVTHTNQIGLRQHLASNNKILLNDDADLIAESYGLYNVNDSTNEHERNIILCGFDGFGNTSRTTGTTIIQIGDKRLAIAIATTGGKLMKNMKNWIAYTGFDGSHNRFLYMCLFPNLFIQGLKNSKYNPSFNHLCIIVHLFGTVRFVFQISEAELTKFCGGIMISCIFRQYIIFYLILSLTATFQQTTVVSGGDEQTQTQYDRSAMFTVWNLIADLIEIQDLKPNEQQQILDFYAKAGAIFPRIACLMQLYFNAAEIFERLKHKVIFVEGDSQDLVVNENFVSSVANIIKIDYHVYDNSYLPYMEINQVAMDPIVIVKKEAVIAAWKWYEHHINIATKLFTVDHEYSSRSISVSSSSFTSKPKTLKQLIMMVDYNIFPLSTITVKHPVTGQTGTLKNRPALGEQALQELLKDNLLKFNHFLTDTRGRVVKSYTKVPVPSIDNSSRTKNFNALINHDINIEEYCYNYEKCFIPPNNNFSKLSIEIFDNCAAFVNQYSKYRNHLISTIHKHMENQNIGEAEDGNFIIINQNAFSCQFENIDNIVLSEKKEQMNGRSQLENINGESAVEQAAEKTSSIEHHSLIEISIDSKQGNVTEVHEFSNEIDNSSDAIGENQIGNNQSFVDDDIHNESSILSVEPVANKITTVDEIKGTEQMIKKAMRNIMTSKSIIFTKTHLTQICNKAEIRLEAVKRLVTANLLHHANNLWIEPSRMKKLLKKLENFYWVNIGYEEYIQSFYPQQNENVFTYNNWTLSDEFINIVKSNSFYTQHVRWSIQRFRPCDVVDDEPNSPNDVETLTAQIAVLNESTETTENNNHHETSQRKAVASKSDEEEEDEKEEAEKEDAALVKSIIAHQKRKAQVSENVNESETCRRTKRRMRK